MREVFPDMEREPKLLPFQDEDLGGRTANGSCNARLDIRARGFWTRQQDAFFDIRVTHPKANLLSVFQVSKHLSSHEREKKADMQRGSMTSTEDRSRHLSSRQMVW